MATTVTRMCLRIIRSYIACLFVTKHAININNKLPHFLMKVRHYR